MKIPTTVRVGVVEYRITADPDEWMRDEHRSRATGNYGASRHREAVIFLNPDSSESVTKLTLWHEVLHCVMEAAMGSPSFEAESLGRIKEDREERIVRMFEAPTLNVLRDNRALVAYLTS